MALQILRARGFRLYTNDGRRLIDLWQNGGAAVLGHTPANILRELKNTASRGLYAPFPHFAEGRYLKALAKLFPGYVFRLHAGADTVKTFFEKSSHGDTGARGGEGLRLWRPFVDPERPFAVDEGWDFFVPVLPGIQTWRDGLPLGLCVAAAKTENLLAQFPQGDILSPILLAVAARGAHDILAARERARPQLPKVFKSLQSNETWERRGIYLSLKEKPSGATWAALCEKFLEAGFLLPPDPSQPVILPGELSAGEDAKLAAALTQIKA
jgi:hypothetical protein